MRVQRRASRSRVAVLADQLQQLPRARPPTPRGSRQTARRTPPSPTSGPAADAPAPVGGTLLRRAARPADGRPRGSRAPDPAPPTAQARPRPPRGRNDASSPGDPPPRGDPLPRVRPRQRPPLRSQRLLLLVLRVRDHRLAQQVRLRVEPRRRQPRHLLQVALSRPVRPRQRLRQRLDLRLQLQALLAEERLRVLDLRRTARGSVRFHWRISSAPYLFIALTLWLCPQGVERQLAAALGTTTTTPGHDPRRLRHPVNVPPAPVTCAPAARAR